MRWTKWEKMSYAKYRGGTRFRDISNFSQALIERQRWGITQHPDSLVVKVLKVKYLKNSHFLNAKTSSSLSFVCTSWGRQVLQRGIR